MEQKLLLPPFTLETALQKVQLAEDAWNSKDPERICLAYTIDTEWRNRTDFINGREAVKEFLKSQGIESNRVTYQGFGSSQPLFALPEKNENERAANRRVEILIIENQ